MTDRDDDKPKKQGSLLGTAIKTGGKAWSTAATAFRSSPVRRLRGGLKSVAGGIVGVTRFIRTNSLRGLLSGRLVITERGLNRWFGQIEPPEGISALALKCRPSRLVLAMSFERRLLGVPLGKTRVELPFEVEHVYIDHQGGTVELRLDREALPEVRGFVRPIVYRLLSRAAADLLDEGGPLERFDSYSDVLRREGDLLIIDVGRYPPFVDLMNRELRGLGGRSIFPFRALVVKGVRVEEGRLIVLTRIDREQLAARRRPILDEMDELPDDDELEVSIVVAEDDEDG